MVRKIRRYMKESVDEQLKDKFVDFAYALAEDVDEDTMHNIEARVRGRKYSGEFLIEIYDVHDYYPKWIGDITFTNVNDKWKVTIYIDYHDNITSDEIMLNNLNFNGAYDWVLRKLVDFYYNEFNSDTDIDFDDEI